LVVTTNTLLDQLIEKDIWYDCSVTIHYLD